MPEMGLIKLWLDDYLSKKTVIRWLCDSIDTLDWLGHFWSCYVLLYIALMKLWASVSQEILTWVFKFLTEEFRILFELLFLRELWEVVKSLSTLRKKKTVLVLSCNFVKNFEFPIWPQLRRLLGGHKPSSWVSACLTANSTLCQKEISPRPLTSQGVGTDFASTNGCHCQQPNKIWNDYFTTCTVYSPINQ